MYTLGIETSCDETSCAILQHYKVLANVTISSLLQHKRYGGVIPEIATRAHLATIDKVFTAVLHESGIPVKKIELIAVTYTPGLFGALAVGLNFAKALAMALDKPFIGINHLYGHLFAAFLNNVHRFKFPFLGLVVSGGHTELYRVDDFDQITLIGRTCDDACGEVYDKVARVLELGYPGGPVIDRLFNSQYKDEFPFKCGKNGFMLSFSGIKTAVLYKAMDLKAQGRLTKGMKVRLVSTFQAKVVDTIVKTVEEASQTLAIKRVVCGGGVVANSYLRQCLIALKQKGITVLLPPHEYTGDNGAVIGGLGHYLYSLKKKVSPLTLAAEA